MRVVMWKLWAIVLIVGVIIYRYTIDEKTDNPVDNFREAKEVLAKRVYDTPAERRTFYCGCLYTGKEANWKTCGYKPRKNARRAKRIEWEHVVPASFYGRTLSCWSVGGRKTCQKYDNAFNQFESDLHNLVPSIGEVNGDRSDKLYGVVSNYRMEYGRCQFWIEGDIVEPRDEIKGDVARIWLYMDQKYNLRSDPSYIRMLKTWAANDPTTDAERQRNNEIAAIQGDRNPFVY